MRCRWNLVLPILGAAGLCACAAPEPPPAPPPEPYRLDVPMQILMRGPVTFAAEYYWQSVSVVIDLEGVHENHPETDEEWETVWAAAITLAESANLLMLPGRALDQGEWMRLANAFYDVGREAARAAEDQDFEAVLDVGEKVYNVCVECHRIYVPALPDL